MRFIMTSGELSGFELEILKHTKAILDRYANAFCKEGVLFRTELRKSDRAGAKYNSEVGISFFDDNGLFDVLEFFVCFEGKPAVSKEEITGWLPNNIDDVLRQRSEKHAK
jgi:hypothetical protein